MIFAIVLGIVVGGAGVLLIQQWLSGALVLGRSTGPVLSPAQFPHLAPPGPRRRAA
jgi:hypothetical protein